MGGSVVLSIQIKETNVKKLIYSLLTLSILFTIGCEDEAAAVVDCVALTSTYTTASETFTNGFLDGTATKAQCTELYDAMAELIDKDCMTLAQMEMTQAALDSAKEGLYCDMMFP